MKRPALLAAALALLLAPAASAGGNPLDEGKSLGAILSHGVPTDPVDPGEWRVKLSPGIIQNHDSSDGSGRVELHGWGASAAVTRGLGEHWGLALIAGGDSLTGDTPLSNSRDAAVMQAGKTLWGNASMDSSGTTAHGVLVAAGAVWDHWTGAGFRLPITVGVSYTDMVETAENAGLGAKVEGASNGPGVYVGVVPQFPVGKFRISPFATFSDAFQGSKITLTKYNPATGATIQTVSLTDSENSDNRQTHTLGVAVGYVPWGLGFSYIPAIDAVAAYTLTYSRKFGGATP